MSMIERVWPAAVRGATYGKHEYLNTSAHKVRDKLMISSENIAKIDWINRGSKNG